MATNLEKAQLALNSKNAIKTAIQNKGVSVDGGFSTYASKISDVYDKGKSDLLATIPENCVMTSSGEIQYITLMANNYFSNGLYKSGDNWYSIPNYKSYKFYVILDNDNYELKVGNYYNGSTILSMSEGKAYYLNNNAVTNAEAYYNGNACDNNDLILKTNLSLGDFWNGSSMNSFSNGYYYINDSDELVSNNFDVFIDIPNVIYINSDGSLYSDMLYEGTFLNRDENGDWSTDTISEGCLYKANTTDDGYTSYTPVDIASECTITANDDGTFTLLDSEGNELVSGIPASTTE